VTVSATINGHGPYRLAIDSGSAAILRVTPDLAQRLGLPQIGVVEERDPSGQGTRPAQIVTVESVAIGSAQFRGVETTVGINLTDSRTGGIIGLGLFEQLLVTLDYPRSALHLTRTAARPGPHSVAFTREQGVPRIDIRAGGLGLKADVDTGGPALLTAPSSAGVPLNGQPKPAGKGRTTQGEFDIKTAPLAGELAVAGWTRPSPMVDIIDALPMVSIGAAFLRDYAVTFDMPRGRLLLSR
jgi:hypothetical protein